MSVPIPPPQLLTIASDWKLLVGVDCYGNALPVNGHPATEEAKKLMGRHYGTLRTLITGLINENDLPTLAVIFPKLLPPTLPCGWSGSGPLWIAAQSGQARVCQFFLDLNAEDYCCAEGSALSTAAFEGHRKLCRYLTRKAKQALPHPNQSIPFAQDCIRNALWGGCIVCCDHFDGHWNPGLLDFVTIASDIAAVFWEGDAHVFLNGLPRHYTQDGCVQMFELYQQKMAQLDARQIGRGIPESPLSKKQSTL